MPNPTVKIGGSYRIVRLADFSLGENRKSSDFSLTQRSAARVKNFYLARDGSLIGRRGSRRWNSTSLGSGSVRGSTRAYAVPALGGVVADQFWVAYHGTSVYLGDDLTASFSASRTGLSSIADMWFLQVGKFLYSSNGADNHEKLDVNAQTWTPWGIAAPTAACTLAAGAAGTLTGSYVVRVTFVIASGAESSGGPDSNTVTVTAQQINVTGIPLGPAGTTARRLYGFKTSVSSVFQRILEIANNTATTSTITTDQDAWGVEIPTTGDVDRPPASAWISAFHKNRIWMIGDKTDKLYFSKVGVPQSALEQFPAENFLTIQFRGGDYGTALMPMGDVLFVFGHDSVHYIAGDTPGTFKPIRTFATAGCPGPWAVDKIQMPTGEVWLVYLSRNGVMVIQGRETVLISEPEEPFFTDLPEMTDAG